MNSDTATAKRILTENNYTCVLYNDGTEYHSTLRGVKPLIEFLESGKDYGNFCAADKTIGAGAAHLYVLLGIKSVWANIISEDGRKVLEKNGVSVCFEKEVPFIINRAGDGACPIESAVKGIADSSQALVTIKQTLKDLTKQA